MREAVSTYMVKDELETRARVQYVYKQGLMQCLDTNASGVIENLTKCIHVGV